MMKQPPVYFNALAQRIADTCSVSADDAAIFLKAVVETIEKELVAGNFVVVESIGTFSRSADGKNISFLPAKELNSEVNTPFSAFEPVELAAGFPTDEQADGSEVIAGGGTVVGDEAGDEGVGGTDDGRVDTHETAPMEPLPETEKEKPAIFDQVAPPTVVVSGIDDTGSTRGRWFFWGGLAIGVAIGFIVGFLLRPPLTGEQQEDTEAAQPIEVTVVNDEKNEAVVAESTHSADSAEPAPALTSSHDVNAEHTTSAVKPREHQVLDTIKPGVFLTTLSRKHFDGRYEFWIYIYEENKDRIANPQNVPVGTVLVIPDREKYGIDPNSRVSIDKAKKAVETYDQMVSAGK